MLRTEKNQSRARKLSLGGAVVAAIAASSCCIAPLILAAFGVAGGGALAAFAEYRPYLLAVTFVVLGIGFYLTYRKPKAVAGDACGCERPKAGRGARIGLWVATVLVVLFAAAPSLIGVAQDAFGTAPAFAAAGAPTEQARLRVDGMTCESCAVHVKEALTKVGGFHDLTLDLPGKNITVTYEPAPGRLEAYAVAIQGLGYAATLPPASNAAVTR